MWLANSPSERLSNRIAHSLEMPTKPNELGMHHNLIMSTLKIYINTCDIVIHRRQRTHINRLAIMGVANIEGVI